MIETSEIAAYWDHKFLKEKFMWGLDPSQCAVDGSAWLAVKGIPAGSVLDVGCGYARDAGYLSNLGFHVNGVDISEVAIDQARKLYPEIAFHVMNISSLALPAESYDGVFGNFILHLFTEDAERVRILSELRRVIKTGGYLFITVASVQDSDFGKGEVVGDKLFRNERGVVKYYYDLDAIHNEFASFSLNEVREITEQHTHDQPHIHKSYLIIAQKN